MPLLRCTVRLGGGRRGRTLIGRVLRGLLAIVALYLGAALVGAFVPGRTALGPDGPATAHILLIAGPIHYDILLPADADTRAGFAFAAAAGVPIDDPDVAWIAVGWGSAAFYTTAGTYADIRPGAVWRAVTGDDAVLRVDVLGPLPDVPAIRRVAISAAALARLRAAVLADLAGRDALPMTGFSATDAFFPARGRFDLMRTCNSWVGRMLRQAGLPMGAWTPTPYAVTLSLWWQGHLS